MDAITTLLMGEAAFELNANFICNLVVLTVFMEGLSVAIGHIASIGR